MACTQDDEDTQMALIASFEAELKAKQDQLNAQKKKLETHKVAKALKLQK